MANRDNDFVQAVLDNDMDTVCALQPFINPTAKQCRLLRRIICEMSSLCSPPDRSAIIRRLLDDDRVKDAVALLHLSIRRCQVEWIRELAVHPKAAHAKICYWHAVHFAKSTVISQRRRLEVLPAVALHPSIDPMQVLDHGGNNRDGIYALVRIIIQRRVPCRRIAFRPWCLPKDSNRCPRLEAELASVLAVSQEVGTGLLSMMLNSVVVEQLKLEQRIFERTMTEIFGAV